MKSVFAIRKEDALGWHPVPQPLAGVAERAGYRVRALPGRGWEVWATNNDMAGLRSQLCDR